MNRRPAHYECETGLFVLFLNIPECSILLAFSFCLLGIIGFYRGYFCLECPQFVPNNALLTGFADYLEPGTAPGDKAGWQPLFQKPPQPFVKSLPGTNQHNQNHLIFWFKRVNYPVFSPGSGNRQGAQTFMASQDIPPEGVLA